MDMTLEAEKELLSHLSQFFVNMYRWHTSLFLECFHVMKLPVQNRIKSLMVKEDPILMEKLESTKIICEELLLLDEKPATSITMASMESTETSIQEVHKNSCYIDIASITNSQEQLIISQLYASEEFKVDWIAITSFRPDSLTSMLLQTVDNDFFEESFRLNIKDENENEELPNVPITKAIPPTIDIIAILEASSLDDPEQVKICSIGPIYNAAECLLKLSGYHISRW
jgi:hypothetical protein